MMNPNATHKIAVGIGMAAVFGLGVSVFAVRAGHQSQLARNALATALEQNATEASAPAQGTASQLTTDQERIPSSSPPPVAPEAASSSIDPANGNTAKAVASTATSDQAKPVKAKPANRAVRRATASSNNGDAAATDLAPASRSDASPADGSGSSGVDSPVVSKEPAPQALPAPAPAPVPSDMTQPAPAGAAAGASADVQIAPTSGDPVASDSQITAQVKSGIAAAVPAGKIEVTTANGMVALAGTVPNQAAIDQARQAAQLVAGVKQVDASALAVGNP